MELFSFGYKLLLNGLINTIYQNIYYLIIGKYFSAAELGFYTRAEQFKKLPSENINGVIQRVTFPVLASIQDDNQRLKANYQKLLRSIVLITFVLMIGMAAFAESLIISLIGEKWRLSVIYLQMLCFVGMMYPLHSLNLNILNVKGRSDLFLKLTIIKRMLAIPTIIIGVFYGIKIMIAGMMVNTVISYYLNSYWSGKLINYPMKEQITDIMPYFVLAMLNGTIVFAIGILLPFDYWLKLIIQILSTGILIVILLEIFKLEAYLEIKGIISLKYVELKNRY
jgi:O-antigen/teichoic acid export membrane protein